MLLGEVDVPGGTTSGAVAVVVGDAGDAPRVEQLDHAGVVIDVVVRDHGEVDGGDAERVEQRADLRAAAPEGRRRRAACAPVGETMSVPAPWPMSTKKMRALPPPCAEDR